MRYRLTELIVALRHAEFVSQSAICQVTAVVFLDIACLIDCVVFEMRLGTHDSTSQTFAFQVRGLGLPACLPPSSQPAKAKNWKDLPRSPP